MGLHGHASPQSRGLKTALTIYQPNGDLKEIRPVGSYVSGQAGDEPHTEGGGDQDVIVFFTNRGIDGPVYEILNDRHETVITFGMSEFKALFQAQASSTT